MAHKEQKPPINSLDESKNCIIIKKKPFWEMGEDIAITGISGKFPESDNIDEFAYNLYNKIDMISEDERRWPNGYLGLLSSGGKINAIDKFDAKFFNESDQNANYMDPQTRIMLEVTYEAIWDSGNDPNTLSGSNTGVFIGSCLEQHFSQSSMNNCLGQNFDLIQHKETFSQIIPYKLNLCGPSILVDSACASSFSALQEAIIALRNNCCENAIVIGINLSFNPLVQFQFLKMNMLSPDGRCMCLDESANGYVKGDAIVAIFLQKKSFAKRIYATLVHSKSNNDGYGDIGITYPVWERQRDIIKATYDEIGINPLDVQFIEAHCTGTSAGDPEEMRAICDATCKGRENPLLIGALKSNIGHTEGASGIVALIKVIVSLENECIPPNLHFKKPNPLIEGLMNGILKPVIESTPFYGDLVGLNNFGFGGTNVHIIVKSPKIKPQKDNQLVCDRIPRLIQMCGRSEESINYFFDTLMKSPTKITRDLLSLINDISKTSPFKCLNNDLNAMRFRGFSIIQTSDQNSIQLTEKQIKKVSKEKKQIWFIFSCLGTQWPAMAQSLMNIEIFEKSIQRSAEILNQFNIDLIRLLIDKNQNIIDSALYSMITIAAIQIALVDLLFELDIRPDGIIGHSIGELVCAYADGCLSAEETILIAYWRGLCVEQFVKKTGKMAVIGLGRDEIMTKCPPKVSIACDNAEDSVTISGKKELIDNFINDLNNENIPTFEGIGSCGIAFHSPVILYASKLMLNKLKSIITTKRVISSKWISTTYYRSEEDNKIVNYLLPEYFVDNLLFPVLFLNALKRIPKNAVIIEISPHHLLKPIILRSLGRDMPYIPLMRKDADNMRFLLTSIGNLYTHGFNPSIEKLYPKVVYPVSNGTRIISPLIKWKHTKNYVVYKYPECYDVLNVKYRTFEIDLVNKDDAYLNGHRIDGKILFPASGYLLIAWVRLADFYSRDFEKLAVEFRDVVLHRATFLSSDIKTQFQVYINTFTNTFSITESGAVVANGKIYAITSEPVLKFQNVLNENPFNETPNPEKIILDTRDIYKELRLRGYDYRLNFQCLSQLYCINGKVNATIKWNNNWVTFLDNMLQMSILSINERGLALPVGFELLRCDPKALQSHLKELGDNPRVEAYFDRDLRIGVTKGAEFHGIKGELIQRNFKKPIIWSKKFVAFNGVHTHYNENILIDYKNACDRLALNVAEKFCISSDFIQKYKSEITIDDNNYDALDSKENAKLYEFLNDLIKCNDKNGIQQLMTDMETDLDNDLLIGSFNSEVFLNLVSYLVFENQKSLDINVLEINNSFSIMYSNIKKNFGNLVGNQYLTFNYTLIHPSPDDLPNNLLNNQDLKRLKTDNSLIPSDIEASDLVIYKDNTFSELNSKTNPDWDQLLESIWNKTKSNGFVIIVCKESQTFAEQVICELFDIKYRNNHKIDIIRVAEKVGFTLISSVYDIFSTNLLLFRKLTIDIQFEKQVFIHISDEFELWVEKLQKELKSIESKPEGENIWLIANDKPTNGILGFFNCLKKEPKGHRIRCLLNLNPLDNEFIIDVNNETFKTILKNDIVLNILQNGKLGYFYSTDIDFKPVMTEHCYLNVSNKGDLSSLKWFESQHIYWPIGQKIDQILCHVYYAALNFKDIMLATGRLPSDSKPNSIGIQDSVLGFEFSGIDENGNRVMGITPSKALATTCIVEDVEFLWPVPYHWSLEDSATVPVVYATAYYALLIRGQLKRGEKVLIHSGSGGVGLAAINICQSLNCQIFVTVGSDVKRDFLKKLYPRLSDRNFSSSRDLSFKNHIMNETKGLGVDVVLNSLAEDKLVASLECLAKNGRFLEIGKYDMTVNNNLDITELIMNKSFHGIFLDTLFMDRSDSSRIIAKHRQLIWQMIKLGINDGTVKPLNRTVFDLDKCEEAFRYMANGKHMGKVVIKIRDEQRKSLSKPLRMLAIPRTVFYPNKSYIITGGLGGMGLELTSWMIDRGAKHFVITSRTGPKEPYQLFRLKYFAENGANIVISTEDLTTIEGTEILINRALKMGPIGGIFHLALIIKDGLFENQTVENFKLSCTAKSYALKNLDVITRKLCPNIDYFVAFSSVAARGNPGQTNYGYTNSVVERICELRYLDGFSGLAIEWGPIGDVGFMAEHFGNDPIIMGCVPQSMPSCLLTLDRFLQSNNYFSESYLKSETSFETMRGEKDLMKRVAHILGIDDCETLDPNTKLVKLGMDSLMTVEIKQAIERDFKLVLSVQDIRDLTLGKIQAINSGGDITTKSPISIDETLLEIPKQDIIYLNDVKDGNPIFFLPATDGKYKFFSPIAKRIDRPVICLNWTLECSKSNSIEEASTYFIKLIRHLFPDIGYNFDLIGYSFGGFIIYDIYHQLNCQQIDKDLKRPRLIFLDISPVKFNFGFSALMKTTKLDIRNDEDLTIAYSVYFLMDKVDIGLDSLPILINNIKQGDKLAKIIEMIQSNTSNAYDPEIITFAYKAYIKKFQMLKYYTIEPKILNTDILLLRADDTTFQYKVEEDKLPVDYGFSQSITGKCEVAIYKGSHSTFLTNNTEKIADSINSYLIHY